MKIERAIVEVLFNDIDPQYIIDYISHEYKSNPLIDEVAFYRYSKERFKKNSMDEVERIYVSLREENIDFNDPGTFFKYLGQFTSSLLVYNEYEPKIKYSMLMRWNKISHLLGQDLLTMSYLAYHDYNYRDWTDFFAYKSVISTDNRQLKNILSQGIVENHFHLKGSTQIFCLNWISLMNHPYCRNKEFKAFTVKLKPYYKYDYTNNYTLHDMIKLATIIRMYFFIKTSNYLKEKKENKQLDINLFSLYDLKKDLITKNKLPVFDKYLDKLAILKGNLNYKAHVNLDYALLGNAIVPGEKVNYALIGERKLIYLSVRMILANRFTKIESIFFYLYILIKNNFRRELIQVNDTYGFSNFSDYEQRKEIFIERFDKYKNELLKMAVEDTFNNQNIISLETRVAPKNTAYDDIKYISHIDKICEKYRDKLFYVFHFIKRKETFGNNNSCRNYMVRKDVEHQSKCLALCLEKNYYFRDRVKGIDACNNEFFCRPEVFGQCFRFLSNLYVRGTEYSKQVPIEIYKTYHVGEDFTDIADGLRAIDETILFCNLENGSRLGHATVLGIDVDEYYRKKDRIIMPKLDFVDNIFWLLNKAKSLNIDIGKYPDYQEIKIRCYSLMDEIYGDVASGCTDSDYYKSWMLRGDNPYSYMVNGELVDRSFILKYDFFALNKWVKGNIRTKAINKLYYAYHFDKGIKDRGKIIYDFKINSDYINLIKEVQKKMQFEIARKGIFIECNPTSNYLIANLSRYEKHPIVTFYNDELYNGNDNECAQINVSINTDDQGVFDTSLENEYALMAYSLENCCDNNDYRFTPNKVYKWIESIRKMGIQQKFK